MPVNMFNHELDRTLDAKFNTGIYQSGKKVAKRLIQQYVKPKRSIETQTESIKEITASYELQIEKLEDNISVMQTEYERATKEASKLNFFCRDLNAQKKQLNDELQQVLQDFQKAQKTNKDFAYKEKRLRDEFDEARK